MVRGCTVCNLYYIRIKETRLAFWLHSTTARYILASVLRYVIKAWNCLGQLVIAWVINRIGSVFWHQGCLLMPVFHTPVIMFNHIS
jgi:hypothetical protein